MTTEQLEQRAPIAVYRLSYPILAVSIYLYGLIILQEIQKMKLSLDAIPVNQRMSKRIDDHTTTAVSFNFAYGIPVTAQSIFD